MCGLLQAALPWFQCLLFVCVQSREQVVQFREHDQFINDEYLSPFALPGCITSMIYKAAQPHVSLSLEHARCFAEQTDA